MNVDLTFNHGENAADCAIAAVDPGLVWPTNYGLGNISSEIVQPYPGQAVQKYRRHGLTSGAVRFVNMHVDVGYESGAIARFADQFYIQGTAGSPFAIEGDSGSLVLEQNTNRPVGLVVGGVSGYTVAPPINTVLNALGVSLLTQFAPG